MLIDALAPQRTPFTLQEATRMLAERSGSHVAVCERTIRRDLELLVSMGFTYIHRKGTTGTRNAGSTPTLYKMEIRVTTIAGIASKKMVES
jgi:predicted DNA-binding transcriptional regulator YafY